MTEDITRLIAAILGAVFAYIEPTLNYIIIGIILIIIDNITAFQANRRVKRKYPSKVRDAKYKSVKAAKTITKILEYSILILIVYSAEKYVISSFSQFPLTAIASAIFCFVEGVSILENYNTANNNPSKFVQLLHKIVVDKSERYFDIDLDDDGKIGKN